MNTAPASVVIPLLRQPDAWLAQCVQSALRQSVPAEVIVVTAGDTPSTNRRLLAELGRRRPLLRILERRHPGFAGALNLGIGAAASERVGFLLADDWLHHRAVEKCLALDADIVSTQVANYAADGRTALGIDRRITMEGYRQKTTQEQRANYLSHFYLFRRRSLLDVGGVDTTIGETGADDYDLVWTLLERNASAHIVEEILYCKRDHHGERLTLRDPELAKADLEKIYDKHRVHGEERRQLVAQHSRWFGRPIHEVVAGGR